MPVPIYKSNASRSGSVTTGAVSTLVALGVPQATLDGAEAVLIANHSTANRLIYTIGDPASPTGSTTKREVLGQGLVEDYEVDTPVGTAGSEHGIPLLPGQTALIEGNANVRRLRIIAQTANIRVTVTPMG
jgi:hypothetical protein